MTLPCRIGIILLAAATLLSCGLPLGPASPTPEPATPTPALEPSLTPEPSATAVHADWPMYTSPECGFSIRYPPEGSLMMPEDTVVIYLPIRPATNLQEKYLDVFCRPAAGVCQSPNATGYAPGSLPSEVQAISGVDFTVQSAGEGAAGNFYDWTAYSVESGGHCVALTFVMHSTNALNYTPPLPEFDRAVESAIFEEIMATFGWNAP